MFPLEFLAALVALLLIASVRADTNITIDDTDPRIIYRPNWSFQGNTDATQDRFNKTTHFTSKQGASGSLTFSGALYVFFVGYGIMDLPSPAYIPVTLQTQNGSGITVQCDAYRPKETRAQSVLFSSDRLDTRETYTITVTKTNGTESNSINIDAFVLTQAEGESVSISSLAQTAAPVISSFGFPGAVSTIMVSPAQTSSPPNAESNNAAPNTAAIAGGVLGGIAFGIIVTFFVFRWWTKREREKRALMASDLPSTSYSDEFLRRGYFGAAPPYQAKLTGAPPRARMPHRNRRRHHSVTSSFGHAPPLTPLSTTAARSSVSENTRVHRGPGKAQYMGNSTFSGSLVSGFSPIVPPSPEGEGTEYHVGADLPAYSRM